MPEKRTSAKINAEPTLKVASTNRPHESSVSRKMRVPQFLENVIDRWYDGKTWQ